MQPFSSSEKRGGSRYQGSSPRFSQSTSWHISQNKHGTAPEQGQAARASYSASTSNTDHSKVFGRGNNGVWMKPYSWTNIRNNPRISKVNCNQLWIYIRPKIYSLTQRHYLDRHVPITLLLLPPHINGLLWNNNMNDYPIQTDIPP